MCLCCNGSCNQQAPKLPRLKVQRKSEPWSRNLRSAPGCQKLHLACSLKFRCLSLSLLPRRLCTSVQARCHAASKVNSVPARSALSSSRSRSCFCPSSTESVESTRALRRGWWLQAINRQILNAAKPLALVSHSKRALCTQCGPDKYSMLSHLHSWALFQLQLIPCGNGSMLLMKPSPSHWTRARDTKQGLLTNYCCPNQRQDFLQDDAQASKAASKTCHLLKWLVYCIGSEVVAHGIAVLPVFGVQSPNLSFFSHMLAWRFTQSPAWALRIACW